MKFAVAAFERFGDSFDGIHDLQTGNEIHVHMGRVTDKTQNRLIFTLRYVDAQSLVLQPLNELGAFFFLYAVFQYNDHGFCLRLSELNLICA